MERAMSIAHEVEQDEPANDHPHDHVVEFEGNARRRRMESDPGDD